MDITQLKAFITIAHTQNLTQAAEKLFLSQPAVSAQIKAIESNVGTPLFTRTNNGMQLTRAGEVLLPEAESLLQHKHRLEVFAQTLSEHYVQNIQLGLIHPINSSKVSALTQNIMQASPDVHLHIQYGMSGEILSLLLAKKTARRLFLGTHQPTQPAHDCAGKHRLFADLPSPRRGRHSQRFAQKPQSIYLD